MKFPSIPKPPGVPLSDDEVLIGSALAFVDQRGGFLPSELVATNRRIVLSTPNPNLSTPITMLIILWIVGVMFFASGAVVLGGLAWCAALSVFIARIYYWAPRRLEGFPLDSVVLCMSENELSMTKALRVTLVFASGTRWRLQPNGGGLGRRRGYLPWMLRQAGLVVTQMK